MHEPDLTPQPYLQRGQMRQATRRWTVWCAICGLIAAIPIVLETTQAQDDSVSTARAKLQQANTRTSQSQAGIQSARAQLAQHERELKAEEHLTRRPDWSGVIRLVAQQFDKQLMMTGFQLGDTTESKVRSALQPLGTSVPEGSVWLLVSGLALENSEVPGLVMRLERVGLFTRVVLTETKRQTFQGRNRIVFTVACRVE